MVTDGTKSRIVDRDMVRFSSDFYGARVQNYHLPPIVETTKFYGNGGGGIRSQSLSALLRSFFRYNVKFFPSSSERADNIARIGSILQAFR
jgi:hypothetical protein